MTLLNKAVSIYDSLLEQAFAENKEVNTILENMAKLLADPTVNDQVIYNHSNTFYS